MMQLKQCQQRPMNIVQAGTHGFVIGKPVPRGSRTGIKPGYQRGKTGCTGSSAAAPLPERGRAPIVQQIFT